MADNRLDRFNNDADKLLTHTAVGFGKRSFTPKVRVRIRDFFSNKFPTSSVAIPAVALGAEGRANDAGLLSVSVSRKLGVSAGGSASLVFANKLGAIYRGFSVPEPGQKKFFSPTKPPGAELDEKSKPTLEEQFFGIEPSAAHRDMFLPQNSTRPNQVVEYIRDVIERGHVRSDIAIERQEILRELKTGFFQGLFNKTILSPKLAELLLQYVRMDLMFEMMAPVEVDLQDMNERYFGIFTGHISSVEDEFAVGNMPQVKLSCFDKMSLFAKTFVVVQAMVHGNVNVAQTNVEQEARGRENPSIYQDKFQDFANWEAFSELVRAINNVYSMQGHLDVLGEQLTPGEDFTSAAGAFSSEELFGASPLTLMAGLDLDKNDALGDILTRSANFKQIIDKRDEIVLVADRVVAGNFIQKILSDREKRLSESALRKELAKLGAAFTKDHRFFVIDKKKLFAAMSKSDVEKLLTGKPDKRGRNIIPPRIKHAFLFRMWSLPNFVRIAKDSDQAAVVSTFEKAATLNPHFNFFDYRGLSPYWPYQNGPEPEKTEFRTSQGVFKSTPVPLATQPTDKELRGLFEFDREEFKPFFNNDIPDNDVPFRVTGLAQFDKAFLGLDQRTRDATRALNKHLRTQFATFLNNQASGASKLQQLETKTHCHMYTTGLGDLIYKLPRWNNVPRLEYDSFEAPADFVLDGVLDDSETSIASLTELYHGREYVMSDFGLVSRRLYKTEEGKIARLFIQATVDYKLGEAFAQLQGGQFNPTFDGSVMGEEFQALFGNRDATASVAIPIDKALLNNRKVLEHLAQNLLTIMNFQSYTGDFVYKVPRPIELAKTVFSPDNSYLYYVTALSYTWRMGSEFSQSVHGEYGHPLWASLPVPWLTKLEDLNGTTIVLRKSVNEAKKASPTKTRTQKLEGE